VSCFSYERKDEGVIETVLQGFGFFAHGSYGPYPKFETVTVGDKEVLQTETPTSCGELVAAYASTIDRAAFTASVSEAQYAAAETTSSWTGGA